MNTDTNANANANLSGAVLETNEISTNDHSAQDVTQSDVTSLPVADYQPIREPTDCEDTPPAEREQTDTVSIKVVLQSE